MNKLRSLLPKAWRLWLVRHSRLPQIGAVDAGDLRRLKPFSTAWGNDRGTPVDRYYIEAFLAQHAADIQGRVLEIGDDTYTVLFGGNHVEQSEVLHAAPGNPIATYIADLTNAPQLPSDAFDCMVCTQTIHVINDVQAAMATIHRVLKPGGVLLATFPGISRIYRDADGQWLDYWRFTVNSARALTERYFSPDDTQTRVYGNVLSATSFLYGLAAEELLREELDYHDELYQVTIGVRAVKQRV